MAIRLQIFADHEEYHERYSVTIILNWCLVKKTSDNHGHIGYLQGNLFVQLQGMVMQTVI